MGNNFSFVEIAIIWVFYSVFFYTFLIGTYRLMKWRYVRNIEKNLTTFDAIFTTIIFAIPALIVVIITKEYIPYGWMIFSLNMIIILGYVSWKPYLWHMNNPESLMILKEYGYENITWWNTRKIFNNPDHFFVNEKSIAQFFKDGVSIVYWSSVREIFWYEIGDEEKINEYIDILSSEINYVGINNQQKDFEKALDIMKNKFPDFNENWNKRHELPDDEEKGTLLYQKYQK